MATCLHSIPGTRPIASRICFLSPMKTCAQAYMLLCIPASLPRPADTPGVQLCVQVSHQPNSPSLKPQAWDIQPPQICISISQVPDNSSCLVCRDPCTRTFARPAAAGLMGPQVPHKLACPRAASQLQAVICSTAACTAACTLACTLAHTLRLMTNATRQPHRTATAQTILRPCWSGLRQHLYQQLASLQRKALGMAQLTQCALAAILAISLLGPSSLSRQPCALFPRRHMPVSWLLLAEAVPTAIAGGS